MAGPISEILLGAFRDGTQLLGESLGYLGRTGQDVVSGVRLIRLRQARARSPEQAAEYDPQIELLREQQAARWAQWRTLADGRRWAIRSASLLLTVGTAWASPYLVPGLGGTSRALSQDVLILRSDETRSGELQTCVATTCTLDSASVPRDAIAWIGLRGAEPDPPAVNDPAQDEVHLKDSSVHAGQLTFVDSGRVVTERDSYERDKVAWVYLTPPKADEQNQPDQFGAPGDEPPPVDPPPTEDPPPPREDGPPQRLPPRPPRPANDRVQPCPAERPLGGRIDVNRTHSDLQSWQRSSHATLWFLLRPNEIVARGFPWPNILRAYYDADEVVWEVSLSACVDLPGTGPFADEVCSCPGGQAAGRTSLGDGYLVFHPLVPRLRVSLPPTEMDNYKLPGERVCVDGTGSGIIEGPDSSFFGYAGHIHEVDTSCEGQNHHCTAPTVCEGATGQTRIDCNNHADRYAVIPFEGSAEREVPSEVGSRLTERFEWHVCCGCGEPRSGPSPGGGTSPPAERRPPKKDPCGDWANPRAHLDLALDQQKALMDQLAKRYDRYRAILDQAQNYQSDFELVSRNCKLWDAARTLMSFLISNFAPRVPGRLPGQPAFEPAKEFANFISFLEKVLANDASWILPNHEFKDWVSLEDLWDGYKTAYDSVQSSPNELLAGLQQCTDPITHEAIYQDALKYVRLLQEIEPLMEQVQRTLNDLRQKDLDLLDKWNKAHQACLEYQECRGGSAADCDQLQGGTEP